MAGTSASLVIQHQYHLDGEVVSILQLGSYNKVFVSPISHISLHNMTEDILEVAITTTMPSTGNSIAMVAPGSALNFGNLPLGYISQIVVTDTNAFGRGGGNFILNTHYN